MDEFINVSHVFIDYVNRYIAVFCDLNKRTNCSFIFNRFLSFHCHRLVLDFKKRKLL